jgi:FG-GAP-like repeat/S-layer homology domain
MNRRIFLLLLAWVSIAVMPGMWFIAPNMAEAKLLFIAAVNYATGSNPISVAIGDLDGDGDLDLAVTNSWSKDVSVLLGNGDGTFQSAVNYVAGESPFSVAIGDLDGDGDLDMAVANHDSDDVSVLLGNGDGTFQAAVNYAAGNGPHSVAIGDLDGDADLDLATANFHNNNVSVLLGNGDGTFQAAANYPTGDKPNSVAMGDLDGDGDLDMVVVDQDPWALEPGNVLVFVGNGDGTFQSPAEYSAGREPWSVAIGDLDGDGDLDLAVANGDSDDVSVLLGNGDGTFPAAVSYAAGTIPRSVAMGDLDGDDDLDLAVTNARDKNVSVLLGNGDGIFQAAVNYATGGWPTSVAIGDLDGDSDLDMVVTNASSNNVSIFINISLRLFADVPPGYWAEEAIYKIYNAGITKGCSQNPLMYCPDGTVTRTQMAVFLGRAVHGSSFIPPAATGIFSDVPVSYWAADWIEQLYRDGITGGCSTNPPRYCPYNPVTRAQMAIFLLRAKHGSSYTPPAATGIFSDVPVTYWAADWIEQLYVEGITTGCGTGPLRYCPNNSVTRAQMAVFMMRTFGL